MRLCVLIAVSVGAVAWAAGYLQGHWEASGREREKAARAGVGRWVIDGGTGERWFHYGRE